MHRQKAKNKKGNNKKRHKETSGSLCWVPKYLPMSKFIKLCTLYMYNSLCINYTSIKLLKIRLPILTHTNTHVHIHTQ